MVEQNKNLSRRDETKLIHTGTRPEEQFGAVNPPVYRVSTIVHPTVEALEKARLNPNEYYTYGRNGTPTSRAFETTVAALEGGDRAIAVGSGLAAICATMLAFVKQGDHVLLCDSAYSPTRRLSDKFLKRFGVDTTYYNPLIGSDIKALFRPNTRVVYTESPGSHSFEVQDIPAIAEECSKKDIKVVMDNTWSAGFFFKPFSHGVDVSIQAATKYYVGHSDAMLGAITSNNVDIKKIQESVRILGYHAAPDDAYLGLRGMRSLSPRIKRHEENALLVAEWLGNRKEVIKLLHPAFPSCPGHDLWKRDFTGSSGLFSVLLDRYSDKAVAHMIDGLKLFGLGASWGGYESLVLRTKLSRTATKWNQETPCVRFHIGLEDPNDLIDDLEEGLKRLNDFSN